MTSRSSRSSPAIRALVVRTLVATGSSVGAGAPCPPAGKLCHPRTNTTSNGTAEERVRARVQDAVPKTLERTAARDELVNEDDGGYDEEQVNQWSTHVDDEKSCQPQDDQDDRDSPEHSYLLRSPTSTESPFSASMGLTGCICNGRDRCSAWLSSRMASPRVIYKRVACVKTGYRAKNSCRSRVRRIVSGDP